MQIGLSSVELSISLKPNLSCLYSRRFHLFSLKNKLLFSQFLLKPAYIFDQVTLQEYMRTQR